jgi:hypothetical protein
LLLWKSPVVHGDFQRADGFSSLKWLKNEEGGFIGVNQVAIIIIPDRSGTLSRRSVWLSNDCVNLHYFVK